MHYQRWRKTGDPGPAGRRRREHGAWRMNDLGYMFRVVPGTTSAKKRGKAAGGVIELQHRVVMEQLLGRSLGPHEQVHHKNTIRHDNDPSNLEVWTKSQPSGGRPEDLVRWVVHYYADLVEAELKTHKREQKTGQLRLVI